jgi:hypothetical protein
MNGGWLDSNRLLHHWQVTDSYLLALAVVHKGKLVGFDRRLVTVAVHGGRDLMHSKDCHCLLRSVIGVSARHRTRSAGHRIARSNSQSMQAKRRFDLFVRTAPRGP